MSLVDETNRERSCGTARCNLGSIRFESQMLAYVLRQRDAGLSFAVIANALNALGNRGEKGGLWYGASVRRLIQKTKLLNDCAAENSGVK